MDHPCPTHGVLEIRQKFTADARNIANKYQSYNRFRTVIAAQECSLLIDT
jgi:hypothetical protein